MNYQPSRQQSKNADIKAWKQTLLIDKRQIQSFQKDLSKQFAFTSTIPESSQIVNKMLKQNDNKEILLEKQQKKISIKLNQLYSGINGLKQTLKYYEYTNQYLVKVQNQSQGVYAKLQKIKLNMTNQFETLLDAQQALQNDLKLYDHKIQLITSGQYDVSKKGQQNQSDAGNKELKRVQSAAKKIPFIPKPQLNIPKNSNQQDKQKDKQIELNTQLQEIIYEIKAKQTQVEFIQNKINSLGKNLGWNDQDHSDFIKIWNRCQGKNYFEIQDQLGQYFKLYTEEQIRDHMNKNMKFKQFNQQKKGKILQYKQLKQQKKIKQFQILAFQEEIQRKIQNKQKNIKNFQEQQVVMKQKVQQWKKIKQEKKFKEQQMKRQQQQKTFQSKIRRTEQNMYKKQVVNKWKQQQEQKKTQKLRESRQSKRTMAPIDKQTEQRIRQRQEKLVAEKIEKLMKKKYQQEQKLNNQQRLKEKKMVKYSYVNSKLQQKTTAIKQKERQKFDGKNKKDANTFGGNLLHQGIRATPTWMQGL